MPRSTYEHADRIPPLATASAVRRLAPYLIVGLPALAFGSAMLWYWHAESGPGRPWRAALVTGLAVSMLAGVLLWFLNKKQHAHVRQQAMLRQQLQAALAEAQRLRAALDTVPAYIYMKDRDGRYTYANQYVSALFGQPLAAILGAVDATFFGEAAAAHLRDHDRQVLELGQRIEAEEALMLPGSGETRQYWAVKSPIFDPAGSIVGLCGVSTDITAMARAQQAVQQAQQAAESANHALALAARFNETIMLNSPLATAVYRAEGPCVAANEAYAELVGGSRSALLAQNFRHLHSWQQSGLLDSCLLALAQQRQQTRELQLCTSAGRELFAECRILPIELNHGAHVLLQIIDLTQRKRDEDELRHFAFNDALTQLPNRRLFLERLRQAIQGSVQQGAYAAVLFLDLNQFKQLNDVHGHEAGDQLLIAVARRLQHATRASDTVARLGGDEFVVLLEGLERDAAHAQAYVARVAQKILALLAEDYVLGALRYRCSASLGSTLFCDARRDPHQLISDADLAMYRAKHQPAA